MAARLLAAVVGQDLEHGDDGGFRIARRVAADRVVSVVDPDARHGHKSSARSFGGYKGHASVDPDSELVTATTATAGNVGDAAAAPGLLAELAGQVDGTPPTPIAASAAGDGPPAPTPTVYGDSAYGTGPLLASLHAAGSTHGSRSRPRSHPRDTSPTTSSSSTLPPAASPVPQGAPPRSCTTPIRATATTARPASARPVGAARLRGQCTSAQAGRTVTITAYEQELAAARVRQADPTWPPTTARPDLRSSASWPTWSAAATAAAACGSAALPRSPPTSACWPPRSTWPGWACWACSGPQRTAGQQHEPIGVPTSGSRAARRPARQQAACSTSPQPELNGPSHTSHLVS